MLGFFTKGKYKYLDSGEIYEGKPAVMTLGAVPVTWNEDGEIIETGAEGTLFFDQDGRQMVLIERG